MGKNLALLKRRLTFPPISRAKITHNILDWANGICIVQIDAGKGGNGFGCVSQSRECSLHVVLVGRLEGRRKSRGLVVFSCVTVGTTQRHIVFCTVSTPELYAGNHRIIELFGLEKIFKIIDSNSKLNTDKSTAEPRP